MPVNNHPGSLGRCAGPGANLSQMPLSRHNCKTVSNLVSKSHCCFWGPLLELGALGKVPQYLLSTCTATFLTVEDLRSSWQDWEVCCRLWMKYPLAKMKTWVFKHAICKTPTLKWSFFVVKNSCFTFNFSASSTFRFSESSSFSCQFLWKNRNNIMYSASVLEIRQ
jgi:hypothetical protein